MSSHHVIRDEQEPPLIILDDSFNLEVINELLGWSPLLIVEASLLKYFNARRIKVDAVVNLNETDQHAEDNSQAIISYYLERNESKLLHSLISIIQGKDYTGINIFCNAATRALLLEELKSTEKLPYPIDIFVKGEKTIIAFKQVLNKWYGSGQKITFNTALIDCKPSLKHLEEVFEVEKAGTYTFTTSERFIAVTEY